MIKDLQNNIEKINKKSKISQGYLILFKTVVIQGYGSISDWWYVKDIEDSWYQNVIKKLPHTIEKIIKL
jgi:hypothetical protein